MAKLTADPVMQALQEVGIADDNTSRVVIDVRHGHLPIVHIERHGDDKLIDVVHTLAGVEITRKERSTQPDILGYVWTDPRTGEQLHLAPEDVAVLVRAEPEQPAYYVDRMPRVGGPLWLTPDQIKPDPRLIEATGPDGITVHFDPAIPVDTAFFVGSCSCKCGVTNHDEHGCKDKTCDCTTPVSRLVVKVTGIGEQ